MFPKFIEFCVLSQASGAAAVRCAEDSRCVMITLTFTVSQRAAVHVDLV